MGGLRQSRVSIPLISHTIGGRFKVDGKVEALDIILLLGSGRGRQSLRLEEIVYDSLRREETQ